jgi:catechol 2,3-dioxygenase-like lactoylglutathione lyase family enzyme
MKTDHFAVQVADLDAAIEFYTEALGLRLKFKELDQVHHEAFAFLELEGGDLELLQALDEENQPMAFEGPVIRPPYCPHLALKTEDMDQLVATLKQKGITIVKGPMEAPVARWIYVQDLDNNVIEFVQWL